MILKQGNQEKSEQIVSIDIRLRHDHYDIIGQIARYTKQTVEELLAEEVERIFEGYIGDGVINDIFRDAWQENKRKVATRLESKQSFPYKQLTAMCKLTPDKAKILQLVKELSEKYRPGFFNDSVIESIRGFLAAEVDESRLIPKDIAQTLFERWEKVMKQDDS